MPLLMFYLLRSWRMATTLTATAHRFGKSLEVAMGHGCRNVKHVAQGAGLWFIWKKECLRRWSEQGVVMIWTENQVIGISLKPRVLSGTFLIDMKFYSILKESKDSKGCNVVAFFSSLGTSTLMEITTITTSQSSQGGDKGGVWHLRLANDGQ